MQRSANVTNGEWQDWVGHWYVPVFDCSSPKSVITTLFRRVWESLIEFRKLIFLHVGVWIKYQLISPELLYYNLNRNYCSQNTHIKSKININEQYAYYFFLSIINSETMENHSVRLSSHIFGKSFFQLVYSSTVQLSIDIK